MDNVYFEDEGPSEIAETEANQAAIFKDAQTNNR